jgi:hypothetical protein
MITIEIICINLYVYKYIHVEIDCIKNNISRTVEVANIKYFTALYTRVSIYCSSGMVLVRVYFSEAKV